jgi:hypothetical protein
MNPYQMLMQGLAQEPQTPKVKVGLDSFNNVDVAENIGHDKLKKKPYNPYNLVVAPEAEVAPEKRDNFRKEMLRDATE